jgi:Galactose oxidase-like, Early set domain/Kelch motif
MNRFLSVISMSALGIALSLSAHAQTSGTTTSNTQAEFPVLIKEKDRKAPVDYGFGAGIQPSTSAKSARALAAPLPGAIPVGNASAKTKGVFGPAITWPIIGLHSVLLPDGRVMSYGTDKAGQQGGQYVYDVWDPAQGTAASSHLTLTNTTKTDIFCSAQSVLSATGEVLITGGDATVNGVRNYSNEQTEIFSPQDNTIRPNTGMTYARWYPTALDLTNGEALILGGRQDPNIDAPTPEAFNPTTGWRTLTGATSVPALGFPYGNWYYPKSFLTPFGNVFVLGNDGRTFSLNPGGKGSISQLIPQALPGDYELTSLMFAPGKVLSLRANKKVNIINLNSQTPTIATTADIDQVRFWANATVLPDGKVLVTGGSSVANELSGVAYTAQIWNPATGGWTTGAAASKPRLYHSIALLLPDASVLTGAGGAPGPVNNLNAEIFYPPYLYKKDGSGQPAPRPIISSAPTLVHVGQKFSATLGNMDTINKVTMVRTGSVTHAFNSDQRYLPLSYTQSGNQLTITMKSDPDVALPGYYMLFVLKNGVPSVATIVHVVI